MDEPVGLAHVESELLRVADLLEKVTHAIRTRSVKAAETDTAYDIAFSKALLVAKEAGATDPAAKATATVECADQLTERNIAEALYQSARSAGANYRAQLDALRSVATNIRSLTVAG